MWDVLPQADHAGVVHLLRRGCTGSCCPEGCLFVSTYLLDASAIAAIAQGRAEIAFAGRDATGATTPEGVHAQDEEWLLDRVAEVGFKNVGIRHGTWAGRPDGRSPFDILVARM